MTVLKQSPTTSLRSTLAAVALVIVLGTGLAALSACSTTEGFGEDVKHLGGNIEDSAERNK
jgi:predicted small secreted protein